MRTCYTCQKEIKNIEGKYFCSQECWDKYAETLPKIPKRMTIKELVERTKALGKGRKSDIIQTAEKLFN